LAKGALKRKSKNNNGYYKKYEGLFSEGVPHGQESSLALKLSAWPKQHVLINE